jgi:hypothetical protein
VRLVVYDDESMEPITVLNLRSFTERDIEKHGRRYRVPVPEEIGLYRFDDYRPMRIVDLEFEPFIRVRRNGEKQYSWFCFTRATELAMLLNPDWLPGQRPAIEYLQSQNDALTGMLMRAFF